MQKNNVTNDKSSTQELENLRDIILGEKCHLVTNAVKKDARNMVGEVLTEALHDRQKSDGSVNKVLQPLIEESVQHSVTHHSDRLVSSLYPLMGSLVRKSVAAFLTDFMEKTNQLIENSLTIKGLKWRIKAKQSGLTFAQYVAAQTFVYRVEHVFLIHRETGLLLNSVNLIDQTKNDVDLISSMLTAINDFVGDSFMTNEDGLKEELQTVSTDNFNLLIKPGPSAIVVAAVTGNPPQQVNDQLQFTLEDIHRLYVDDLNQFTGDNQPFEHTENLLRDCLLSEQKVEETSQSKNLWFAWIIVLLVVVLTSYHLVQWYGIQEKIAQISHINNEAGIIVKQLSEDNDNQLNLEVLRDPDAINVVNWLDNNNIDHSNIHIKEYAYRSLETPFLRKRSKNIIERYPQLDSSWQENTLTLQGELTQYDRETLLNELASVGLNQKINLNTDHLTLSSSPSFDNQELGQLAFNKLAGRLSAIQLNFAIGSNEISPAMNESIEQVVNVTQQLLALADKLSLNVGVLVIGCSDSTGAPMTNNQLSRTRAKNAADALTKLGLDRSLIFTSGLGEINVANIKNSARKVIFNIIYTKKEQNE